MWNQEKLLTVGFLIQKAQSRNSSNPRELPSELSITHPANPVHPVLLFCFCAGGGKLFFQSLANAFNSFVFFTSS